MQSTQRYTPDTGHKFRKLSHYVDRTGAATEQGVHQAQPSILSIVKDLSTTPPEENLEKYLNVEALLDVWPQPRTEPDDWYELGDSVIIRQNDGEGTASLRDWIAFVKSFMELDSFPNFGAKCLLCGLDRTVSKKVKDTLHTQDELDRHLGGSFHTPTAEIMRAFTNSDKNENDEVKCPACEGGAWFSRRKIQAHAEKEHGEYLQ